MRLNFFAVAAIAILLGSSASSPTVQAQVPETPELPAIPPVAYPVVTSGPDESAWIFFLNGAPPVVVQPVGPLLADATFSLVAVMTGYNLGSFDKVALEINQVNKVILLQATIDDDVGNNTASAEFLAQVGVDYILHVAGKALKFNPLVTTASCVVDGATAGCPEPLCFLPFTCAGVPQPCNFPFVCDESPAPCDFAPGNCELPQPCGFPFICDEIPDPCEFVPGCLPSVGEVCEAADDCEQPDVPSVAEICDSTPTNCERPDVCGLPVACDDLPDPCNIPFACGGAPCVPFVCGPAQASEGTPQTRSTGPPPSHNQPTPNDPCDTYTVVTGVRTDEDSEDLDRTRNRGPRIYSSFGFSVDLEWDNVCAYYRGQDPRYGTFGATAGFYGPDALPPGIETHVETYVHYDGIDGEYAGQIAVILKLEFGDHSFLENITIIASPATNTTSNATENATDEAPIQGPEHVIDPLVLIGITNVAIDEDPADDDGGCGDAWTYFFAGLDIASAAFKLHRLRNIATAIGINVGALVTEEFFCPADYTVHMRGNNMRLEPHKGHRGGVGVSDRDIVGRFDVQGSDTHGTFVAEFRLDLNARGTTWGYASQYPDTIYADLGMVEHRTLYVGDGKGG